MTGSTEREPRGRDARLVCARRLRELTFLGAVMFGTPIQAQEVAMSEPGELTTALIELYDDVRVAGLDDRRFSPETYWEVVTPLVDGNPAFTFERVGSSAEGRPLNHISFGRGETVVMLWSQMHGNESTASMSLADIFAFLGSHGSHPLVEELSERLSLHFVPVLNPDGAARFQRRNAQGIDVNRDARRLTTPEGRILKSVRDRLEPHFGFNLHDQNTRTRVGDSDRGAAIALLAPAFNEARDVNDLRRAAMRVIGVIRTAIEPMVGGHIARYDDTFNPRAFGDLMATWGSSTILIESGGWESDPHKQYLRKVNFVGILSALASIADDSFERVATDLYEELPPNGRGVGDLLLVGGTLTVPGLPPLVADVLVNFDDPLTRSGGVIAEIGDLGETEATDTVSVEGLFVIPGQDAVDRSGGVQIQPGHAADLVVARDAEGREVVRRVRPE